MSPLNPTTFSSYSISPLPLRAWDLSLLLPLLPHSPVSTPHSPIRLLPHYSNKTALVKVTNGLCLAKPMVNSLSSSSSTIIEHNWPSRDHLENTPHHSSGFSADSLTASSQTPFPDPFFLPDLHARMTQDCLKPSFLSLHVWPYTTYTAQSKYLPSTTLAQK